MPQSQVTSHLRKARAATKQLSIAQTEYDTALTALRAELQPEIERAMRLFNTALGKLFFVDTWGIDISGHDAGIQATVTIAGIRMCSKPSHRVTPREVWADAAMEAAAVEEVLEHLKAELAWVTECRFMVEYPKDFAAVERLCPKK